MVIFSPTDFPDPQGNQSLLPDRRPLTLNCKPQTENCQLPPKVDRSYFDRLSMSGEGVAQYERQARGLSMCGEGQGSAWR
ncbi:MAG: hypothetical protein Kow0089_04320 [Desulfobulbaceae bacterium]